MQNLAIGDAERCIQQTGAAHIKVCLWVEFLKDEETPERQREVEWKEMTVASGENISSELIRIERKDSWH